MELQPFAAIGAIVVPSARGVGILFRVAIDRILGGVIIDEPVALGHMQSVGEGRAIHVEHGKRSLLDRDRVDHQRVAFIAADGIAVPRGSWMCGVRRVHAHAAHFVALAVDHRDLVLLLEYLDQEIPKHVRYSAGPALAARRGIAVTGKRNFAVLLYHLGRLSLQDGLGVISYQLLYIRDTVGPARSVPDRTGTPLLWLTAGSKR